MRIQRLRSGTHGEPVNKENSARNQKLSTSVCKTFPPHEVIYVVEPLNNALVTILRATRKCYNPRVILRFAYGDDNGIVARADQKTRPESLNTMLTHTKTRMNQYSKPGRERTILTDY